MKDLVILVCGLAGSGKSTLADHLARELNLKCVHTSDVLRQLKEKKASDVDAFATKMQTGFWETKASQQFNAERLKDLSLDRKLDSELLRIIDAGNVVMDSWTMPWLSKKGFKIWLNVSDAVRFARIASRDGIPLEKAREASQKKESQTRAIYRKAYGFDFKEDESVFHFVLDTSNLNETEVLDAAVKKIVEAKKNGFFV